jgi:hypothetical protein
MTNAERDKRELLDKIEERNRLDESFAEIDESLAACREQMDAMKLKLARLKHLASLYLTVISVT